MKIIVLLAMASAFPLMAGYVVKKQMKRELFELNEDLHNYDKNFIEVPIMPRAVSTASSHLPPNSNGFYNKNAIHDAFGVSYQQIHTSKGITSMITHHGNTGKVDSMPYILSSGSFSNHGHRVIFHH